MRWSFCSPLNGAEFDTLAESALLDRCDTSLSVLEGTGPTHLTLLVRIEYGRAVDSDFVSRRYFHGIRMSKTRREKVRRALWDLELAILQAIDEDIERDGGEKLPSSFCAEVVIGPSGDLFGWSIHCSVFATVGDDHSDLAIKLR